MSSHTAGPVPDPVITAIGMLRSLLPNVPGPEETRPAISVQLDMITIIYEQQLRSNTHAHEAELKETTHNHRHELDRVQTELKQELDRVQTELKHELDRVQTEHKQELDRVQTAHALELMALRHEKELACKDLNHQMARNREKTHRFRTLIAQFENLHHCSIDKIYGTHTAAEFWNDHPKLPSEPSPWVSKTPSITRKTVKDILQGDYAKEEQIYPPLVALVNQVLGPHNRANKRNTFQALDTSSNRYLLNRQPDITIQASPPYLVGPIADFVQSLVEVKHDPKRPRQLGNSDKGQMLDVLYKLLQLQPWRRVFVGLVTTLHHNCIIKLTRSITGEHMVTEVAGCGTLDLALSYLIDIVLPDRSHWPPSPDFSPALGACQSVLGTTKNSLVAQFEWPTVSSTKTFTVLPKPVDENGDGDDKKLPIAVKRAIRTSSTGTSRGDRPRLRSLKKEIELLRQLNSHTCASLPHLACHTTSFSELGIYPVGQSVNPSRLLSRPGLAVTILQDVYDALQYLHDAGLVHRDVRWANIILANHRGVLIDFETAYSFKQKKKVPYAGGFLCMPPRLLRANPPLPLSEIRYEPREWDDWTAYVLLLAAILVPGPGKWMAAELPAISGGFPPPRAADLHAQGGWGIGMSAVADPKSKQRRFLEGLWKVLRRANFWAKYVQIADRGDDDDGSVGQAGEESRYFPLRSMAESVLTVVPPDGSPVSSPASSRPESEADSAGDEDEDLVAGTKALHIEEEIGSYDMGEDDSRNAEAEDGGVEDEGEGESDEAVLLERVG